MLESARYELADGGLLLLAHKHICILTTPRITRGIRPGCSPLLGRFLIRSKNHDPPMP